MEKKKLFALLSKLSLLFVLWGFSARTLGVVSHSAWFGDSVFTNTGYEVMTAGLTSFSDGLFVFGYILIAVFVLMIYSFAKFDTSVKHNLKLSIIISILLLVFGFLGLVTSYRLCFGWWLMFIASLVSCVFAFVSSRSEGDDEAIISHKQLKKASKLIMLLVLIAFFQPVACNESGYEIISDYLFEFDDGILIAAWLLLGILAIIFINLIAFWKKSAEENRKMTAINGGLVLAFLVFSQIMFIREFGFENNLPYLEAGYWVTFFVSAVSFIWAETACKAEERQESAPVLYYKAPDPDNPEEEELK